MLSDLTQFLFNRSQYVVVDDCRSNLVNVESGVTQSSFLGPLFVIGILMHLIAADPHSTAGPLCLT